MLRRYVKIFFRHVHPGTAYQALNYITIDAARMLSNVALIQSQHKESEIIPVLKANAYGHGITQVAEILRASKCRMIAVDGYFEAAKIRDITNKQILVMGHVLPQNVHLLDTKRCSFVVQDVTGLKAFGKLGGRVKIHLELNTGMNRMGLNPSELSSYLKTFKKYLNLELEGIMSHLADADNDQNDDFTGAQLQVFDQQVTRILAEGFMPRYIHLAQTAGSTKIRSRYANAIRLGIGTYGVNPLLPDDQRHTQLRGLQPVLELTSTIVKVQELNKGDKVSYNCTFSAPEKMRVGILALGYYEGVPRELSNKGCMTYEGIELPIVGRVCMDHTAIDHKNSNLQVGDQVTFISKDTVQPNSVLSMQRNHGLFSYTTLVGLSSSVRRIII